MQVNSLKLCDVRYGNQWADKVENCWTYDDFMADAGWREGWISFDCALYNEVDDRVYLGLTCFDAKEIFKAYDRKSGRFVDLGFSKIADPFDAKFHRSLLKGPDSCIYAAPALLHCSDRYLQAPGAAIVKYNPAANHIEKLGIVLPHVYIQSMVMDSRRETLHCSCFTPEHLASYSLRSGRAKSHGLIGSGYGGLAQGECIALDNEGCVWSNWSLTRAWQSTPGPDANRLCKYDPREDRIVFFNTGLPMLNGSYGYRKSEAFFNFGDGTMYASGNNGSLYRIDPGSGEVEYLFTPTPDRPSRLSSLVKTDDGVAYGVTGRAGQCELLRVYYKEGRFEKLGPIVDRNGEAMYQCHCITVAHNDTFYACENDNPFRSSYLWEIHL